MLKWFSSRSHRREAVGGFLTEIASLLVIFPWLDQVMGEKTVHWRFPVVCWLLAIPCGTFGILLHSKGDCPGVFPAARLRAWTAGILVAVFAGLIGISFVSEELEQTFANETARILFAAFGTLVTICVILLVTHHLDALETDAEHGHDPPPHP